MHVDSAFPPLQLYVTVIVNELWSGTDDLVPISQFPSEGTEGDRERDKKIWKNSNPKRISIKKLSVSCLAFYHRGIFSLLVAQQQMIHLQNGVHLLDFQEYTKRNCFINLSLRNSSLYSSSLSHSIAMHQRAGCNCLFLSPSLSSPYADSRPINQSTSVE